MELEAPFTGTLYMPDKEFLNPVSTVLLSDGQAIAAVRRQTWSRRCDILDMRQRVVAECRVRGVFAPVYTVSRTDGKRLVTLEPRFFRGLSGDIITLAGGKVIGIRRVSAWSQRRYEFSGPEGLIGRILPTTGAFSFRPDSYAFEIGLPVMSALQAIGLAQLIRLVVRAQRQAAASS